MTSLSDWPILREVLKPPHTAITANTTIRNVYVFDANVFLITADDHQLYAFGPNRFGCLGVGHSDEVPAQHPQRVDELCDKQVTTIAFNSRLMNALALTSTGQVYGWGRNASGQLANGSTVDCCRPKPIATLDDHNICAIRCAGFGHCLALSLNGSIYSWGNNKYGQTGIGSKVSPQLLANRLTNVNVVGKRFVAIDCGCYHSLALTDDGVVYGFGQLCVGHESSIPIKINANSVKISRIVCGAYHSLLLSSIGGEIYVFGGNDCGQLGNGSNVASIAPQVLIMSEKCIDICATNQSSISMAKLESGFCYYWGECCGNNNSQLTPKATNFKTFNDIIIRYCVTKFNYENIANNNTTPSAILSRLSSAFNDSKYSDVTFKVEDKTIHAHRQYLRLVCKHFEDIFADTDSRPQVINIYAYSYAVYHAFLKYLYTGTVECESENAFYLLELAIHYKERDLMRKCALLIRKEINAKNVCFYYDMAAKFELQELRQFCLQFANENFYSVKDTAGYQTRDNENFLKAMNEYLHNKLSEKALY